MAKVLLSLPDELLKRLDQHCQEFHYERSEYLRMIIRNSIFADVINYTPEKPTKEEKEHTKQMNEFQEDILKPRKGYLADEFHPVPKGGK